MTTTLETSNAVAGALVILEDRVPENPPFPDKEQFEKITQDAAAVAVSGLADDLLAEAGRVETEGVRGKILGLYLRMTASHVRSLSHQAATAPLDPSLLRAVEE